MAAILFPQFPAHLGERILGYLDPNFIACSFRLINKACADSFSDPQYKVIRLSQPVPSHAFTLQWGPTSIILRNLTCFKRLQFLCLTARSGILANLVVAVGSAGLVLTSDVMDAAAAAGHLHIWVWLRQQGCPLGGGALASAARAGHREMCEWMLANGCEVCQGAVCSAALGGHVGLMEWLEQQLPARQPRLDERLLKAVAQGCGLAILQRLYGSWLAAAQQRDQGHGGEEEDEEGEENELILKASLVATAAHSPIPDWRAKVEWLEGQGCPRHSDACCAAALPDAVDRLTWLRQRGYTVDEQAVSEAARTGNIAALEYLLGEAGVQVVSGRPAEEAAREGRLAALQFLHARGCPIEAEGTLEAAAEDGHLAVVVWLVEVLGVAVAGLNPRVMRRAAQSGNGELLAWLHERGCTWGNLTLPGAVPGGCETALEWLVAHGLPLDTNGYSYYRAAVRGDLATLRCLRRLGCPWGPETLFAWCARASVPLPALRWLVAEGCPVDWEAALGVADGRISQDREEVAAWLREEQQRRMQRAAA